MKQYRDTKYRADDKGNIYSYFPAWEKKYPFINGVGKLAFSTRKNPARLKLRKPNLHKSGYLQIVLSHEGKTFTKFIHQVVAECYLGPCPAGYEVDHIDGNKTNNHISNLQYLTKTENLAKRIYSS